MVDEQRWSQRQQQKCATVCVKWVVNREIQPFYDFINDQYLCVCVCCFSFSANEKSAYAD